ncbi:MAG: AIR synthase-related protein, partial [Defluviitaleaceae bacterium]|nr:AIR synthase-related protein [Defluviitaleaceae bacterium]
REEMHNIFNMGIGLVVCVAEEQADDTLKKLKEMGDTAFVIGDIQNNEAGGLIYV